LIPNDQLFYFGLMKRPSLETPHAHIHTHSLPRPQSHTIEPDRQKVDASIIHRVVRSFLRMGLTCFCQLDLPACFAAVPPLPVFSDTTPGP
jgi:hypothetical protein